VLAARPNLDQRTLEAVLFVARTYQDLDTCRPLGMIAGRIPITEIWNFVDRHPGLDAEAGAVVVAAIRYMDDADFAERTKTRSKQPPSPTPRGPRAPIARAAADDVEPAPPRRTQGATR